MAVDVRTTRNTNQGAVIEKHAKATNFSVVDAHLLVTGWEEGTATSVAVYAPSAWVSAKITEEKGQS